MKADKTERTAIDSLYRISSLVSDTEEPKEALTLILEEIINVLQPSSASISLINPDTHRLELEVSHGLAEDWNDLDLALGQGITGWCALHARSIIVPDVSQEPRYISVRSSVRSEMAVPMEDRGVVIGVVNIDSEQLNAFDEQSLKILTLLTNEASRVVSRIWLIQQLRAKAHQLESLINMGQGLVGELEQDEVLRGLAREGRQLMNCHSCALFLLTPDHKQLQLHSMAGPRGEIDAQVSFPIEESSFGAAIHRHKQVEVADLPFTVENDFIHLVQSEGLVSMLATPIVFNNKAIGLLNAYTTHQHRFNNDEKKVFATLAQLGAIAIQNARLYSRIFSSEDSLRQNEKLTTLGMLSAEIAHEIRNPLTVIKLLFESLDLQFTTGDDRQTDIGVIGDKLNQLEEIVSRVLDFGRNRQGAHAHFDLNDLIEDTLRLVRLKLHQSKIEITYHPAPQPLLVEVNKGQIQQVMLNLILNATQVMPAGGRIEITCVGDPAEEAAFIICDNGPGIPERIQPDIFESFLTHRLGGTGLGLSISKRILRDHHGDIELVKSSSAGSTFRFWLPTH